jgi:hypothetical protein
VRLARWPVGNAPLTDRRPEVTYRAPRAPGALARRARLRGSRPFGIGETATPAGSCRAARARCPSGCRHRDRLAMSALTAQPAEKAALEKPRVEPIGASMSIMAPPSLGMQNSCFLLVSYGHGLGRGLPGVAQQLRRSCEQPPPTLSIGIILPWQRHRRLWLSPSSRQASGSHRSLEGQRSMAYY